MSGRLELQAWTWGLCICVAHGRWLLVLLFARSRLWWGLKKHTPEHLGRDMFCSSNS